MGWFSDVGRAFGDVAGMILDPLDVVSTRGIKNAYRDLSGQTAQDEAARAAGLQEEAGQRAITVSEEAQRRLEETLAPFVQALGADLMPQVSSLFGPTAGQSLMQDPALQALFNESQRRIQASQAAGGRPSGETAMMLQDAFLRTGSDLLSRQRGDLLSALGLGQASAAQTGVSGINTAGRTGDLLTQIASAQGAAGLAGAQARAQGLGNILNLGAQGIGMFLSDERLKRNITEHGTYKGHKTYKYQYKDSDQWYIGVMAHEVAETNPSAVKQVGGYYAVDYGAL